MSSCEKKLNGYKNLKRTVGYQSTIIGEFACYILACLSSCLITEWLQLPHEATSSYHRVSVYCTVSCFAGSVFTSMIPSWNGFCTELWWQWQWPKCFSWQQVKAFALHWHRQGITGDKSFNHTHPPLPGINRDITKTNRALVQPQQYSKIFVQKWRCHHNVNEPEVKTLTMPLT